MLAEIYRFEIWYRLRRADTYVFFLFLFIFSLMGVEFVFEGVELGLVSKSSPMVIAKTMGVICGLSALIISLIMGVPILRDHQYKAWSLFYTNPITKWDYLVGRFLGSLTILIFIDCALPMGMMLGAWMPWIDQTEYAGFQMWFYLQPFIWVAAPIITFSATLFFISGALSKNMLVVYIQSLVLFLLFFLTKAIDHKGLQALLDPFSLTTLTYINQQNTPTEVNALLIPWMGFFFWKNLAWILCAAAILFFGYRHFQMSSHSQRKRKTKPRKASTQRVIALTVTYPSRKGFVSSLQRLKETTLFETIYILKQPLFWAIMISAIIVIGINSQSLTQSVYSVPQSYLIVEDLMEMSIYFFALILIIYSGEIVWKDKSEGIHYLIGSTPVSNFTLMASKLISLHFLYMIIISFLILSGVLVQIASGYENIDLKVYFIQFFMELFPQLSAYTLMSFFFQTLTRNKFVGMIATIVFFMLTILSKALITDHILLSFGGPLLPTYSEMNGYGSVLPLFLISKAYWLSIAVLFFSLAVCLMERGKDFNFIKEMQKRSTKIVICLSLILAIVTGSHIFYQVNHLSKYWNTSQENNFRADYERELKRYEYLPQPKIADVVLSLEFYPDSQSYVAEGQYTLVNTSTEEIKSLHIQKKIETHVYLEALQLNRSTTIDSQYEKFHYYIYDLVDPLKAGDSLQICFQQRHTPLGFENDLEMKDVVKNGTYINNLVFPTLGYFEKYELVDEQIRTDLGLLPLKGDAEMNDPHELRNARSGSDSDGINLYITIGTTKDQTAITAGNLIRHWSENGRNYFHYRTDQKIINFFSMVSAKYLLETEEYYDINLEVYVSPKNKYKVEEILKSAKQSIDYFTKNFTPYQYHHLRFAEVPRYHDYAQSLPGMITFSESMGYEIDLYFIIAHEIAHQWWGMQLEAANVKGQNLILETLAQYSALMVMEKHFSQEEINKLLMKEYEEYEKDLKKQKRPEVALKFVQDESHLYYAKGILNMYALKKEVGEQAINEGLRNFLQEWNTENKVHARYATSEDLLVHLKTAIGPDHQDLVKELFEEVHPIDIESILGK